MARMRKRCLQIVITLIFLPHCILFFRVNFLDRTEVDDEEPGEIVRKLKYLENQDSSLGKHQSDSDKKSQEDYYHKFEETVHNVPALKDYSASLERQVLLHKISSGHGGQNISHNKLVSMRRLFSTDINAESDSSCIIPNIEPPDGLCPEKISWKCDLVPTFANLNTSTRYIHVDCPGRFKVNRIDNTEMEQPVFKNSYRPRPKWQYFTGTKLVAQDSEYMDVACKLPGNKRLSHNYFTQFVPNDYVDYQQSHTFSQVMDEEKTWKPLSVLTILLDSLPRSHFHRSCGLPKTAALLKQYYKGNADISHQAFLFNRLNAISGSTVLNLTPLFSGELYQNVDEERIIQGIYAKDIKEWIWQYANQRGYLTSYGVDNASGMMGTRTVCKDCSYRPPVMPHSEHGWLSRENMEVSPNTFSGLCEGNHFLHEHILNYTRDLLRHTHPVKWAAVDLNAGHRREPESINQLDDALVDFLKTVLNENKNLVVFLMGDHGKPYPVDVSHLGGYYETLLPFLSILMPSTILKDHPDIQKNLVKNQQRYMVHADLHHSMKSLLHYPDMDKVGGAKARNALNIFTQEITINRTCDDALMPAWSCVCGFMNKIPKTNWDQSHTSMVRLGLDYINSFHTSSRLMEGVRSVGKQLFSSCRDIHLKKVLHVFVNYNPMEAEDSPNRRIFHITFQAVEDDTVWQVVVNSASVIKQVKQYSLYQKYDVCWDQRVPLPYCVCDRSKPVRKGSLGHISMR